MGLLRLNKDIVSLVLLNLGERQQQSKPLWRKRWHRVFLLTCSKGVLLRCAYFSICVPIEIPNVVVSCSYFISEVSCVCVILTFHSCVACSKSVQKFMFELMFKINIWFFFFFFIFCFPFQMRPDPQAILLNCISCDSGLEKLKANTCANSAPPWWMNSKKLLESEQD